MNKKDPKTAVVEADIVSQPPGKKPTPLRQTFASLRYPNFRFFFVGALLSNIGTWLQTVALSWLVFEMTKSSFYLGLINFSASLPVFFLSFVAGIYADKLNKRKLLIITQVIAMFLAFALGFLVSAHQETIAALILLAFLTGITSAFSFPAWQAFISEIVPKKDLLNAIALNSAQFHTARLLGPFLAGWFIASLGMAACFYLNGASFLAVIIALMFIIHTFQKKEEESSSWSEFKEGLVYIWNNRLVLYLLLGVGILSVFGLSFLSVLMPIFAGEILKGTSTTYGTLMGFNGAGALIGSLAVAYIAYSVKKSDLVKYGMLFYSLSLIGFAFSKSYHLSAFFLIIAGFAFLAVNSTLNTAIQSIVPSQIRGRVMSFFVWMFMGLTPIGSIIAGSLAHYLGAPLAMLLGALIPLSLAIYLILFPPQL